MRSNAPSDRRLALPGRRKRRDQQRRGVQPPLLARRPLSVGRDSSFDQTSTRVASLDRCLAVRIWVGRRAQPGLPDGCRHERCHGPTRAPGKWSLETRKALLCRAFRCAEEDSNLHPVIPDQALNLVTQLSYASIRCQIVHYVHNSGRSGRIGRSGCCHGCCHEPEVPVTERRPRRVPSGSLLLFAA